jgi:hypothetical protein
MSHPEGVAVAEALADGEALAEAEGEALAEADGDGVAVETGVPVGAGVAVGEGGPPVMIGVARAPKPKSAPPISRPKTITVATTTRVMRRSSDQVGQITLRSSSPTPRK